MRPLAASIAVALLLVACRRDAAPTAPVSSQTVGERSLAYVPADTPYVFVAANAQGNDSWMPDARTFHEILVEAQQADGATAGGRMVGQLAAELRDGSRYRAGSELGFTTAGRFVLYGLSLWPVLRLEIGDAAKVRAVVSRVFAAGGHTREQQRAGIPYWSGPANDEASYVVAVRDRELVAALVPAAQLDRALPVVLGIERPARSLADDPRLAQAAARYGFLRDTIGHVDARAVVDLLAGGGQGLVRDLGGVWGKDGTYAACRQDLLRIAAVFPSIVLGYRRIDGRGVDGAFVIESPQLGASLTPLRTVVPDLVAGGPAPLFAVSIAMDAGKLVAWSQQVAALMKAQPFTCAALAELDDTAASMADQLAGLPPMFRSLQGFAITVDDVDVERKTGTGAAIAVGDGVPMLVTSAWAMLPFRGAPVPALGAPVELPLQQLGMPAGFTAHVALGHDRVAVAAGVASGTRVRTTLAAKPAKRTPLVTFDFDSARLAALGLIEDDSAMERVSGTFEATSQGLVFDFSGSWKRKAR